MIGQPKGRRSLLIMISKMVQVVTERNDFHSLKNSPLCCCGSNMKFQSIVAIRIGFVHKDSHFEQKLNRL